jgi:hypothetical protein
MQSIGVAEPASPQVKIPCPRASEKKRRPHSGTGVLFFVAGA